MKSIYPVLLALVLLAGCAEQGKTVKSEDGKFVIEADDEAYYSGGEKITGISVARGTDVEIDFKVRTEDVYFGGLGFKGCGLTSADAKPGDTVKFSFRADSNCGIIAYWPANGAPKKTLVVTVG
jgi:hypothetical protein